MVSREAPRNLLRALVVGFTSARVKVLGATIRVTFVTWDVSRFIKILWEHYLEVTGTVI